MAREKKKDPLALAVAVYRNVSYDEAKAWLDAKEKSQRGSKLKIRKIPEVARLLVEQGAENDKA